MSSRPAVTRMLTLAACVWLQRRGGQIYTEVPLVPTNPATLPQGNDKGWLPQDSYRLDVLHLGPQRAPVSTAIEVKSCRADFTADRKLSAYLGRVNELYIATLPGCIRADELPEGVGLLELNQRWAALPCSQVDLQARMAPWTECAPADCTPGVGDIFWLIKEAQPQELSELAELELLRGAVTRVALLGGTKAMQDREQQLEQMLWLDGVRAA